MLKLKEKETKPSLENLIEELNLNIETLHPGGLETTKQLADMCEIEENMRVLDVASGTGLSAIFLSENYDCSVTGIDHSEMMVKKARKKAKGREVDVEFTVADAHQLPFEDEYFDVVISECTLCLLEKEKVLDEMTRVVKEGGRVGIHDICWSEDADQSLKKSLAEIEGERPETKDGWIKLFQNAGLNEIEAKEEPDIMDDWMERMEREIGISGKLKIFIKVVKEWGFEGLKNIRKSEKIFEDPQTGYIIIVGRKHSGV